MTSRRSKPHLACYSIDSSCVTVLAEFPAVPEALPGRSSEKRN
jgi:hypothetical protein